MTLAAATSVNCTNCGAGLGVLGGGRVEAHVCGYCGSVLDVQDDYKVLETYANMPRPDTPLRLGMTGTFDGVDFTVIGIMGKTERYGYRTWEWVEHQLFSPTHGYAWLILEDDRNWTFSRRWRVQPDVWITPEEVEAAEVRPTRRLGDTLFRYHSSGTGETTFLEGEFTYVPALDDRTPEVTLTHGDDLVSLETTPKEREVWRGDYVSPEHVAQTFGLDHVAKPRGLHPAQPYVQPPWARTARRATLWGAVAALLLALIYWGSSGARVADLALPAGRTELSQAVTFTDTARLARIEYTYPGANLSFGIETRLTAPAAGEGTGPTVIDTARSWSFYQGRDSDGAWTEGARTVRLRFRPPVAGDYDLTVSTDRALDQPLQVRVYESGGSAFWLWIAAAALLLATLAVRMRRAAWEKAKQMTGDWSDE